MPKISYKTKRFNAQTLLLIDQCNQIITTYHAQGYDLTVRQLYYRLVAAREIPNQFKEYKRLVRVLSEARLAGLIDWYAITDRTRSLRGNSHWDNALAITEQGRDQFQVDRWADQPFRPEVWIEKDALIGVIGRICQELDVPYFSCRGYASAGRSISYRMIWRKTSARQEQSRSAGDATAQDLGPGSSHQVGGVVPGHWIQV